LIDVFMDKRAGKYAIWAGISCATSVPEKNRLYRAKLSVPNVRTANRPIAKLARAANPESRTPENSPETFLNLSPEWIAKTKRRRGADRSALWWRKPRWKISQFHL
jgi:hypothetical protein